jgi:hypothetical protein
MQKLPIAGYFLSSYAKVEAGYSAPQIDSDNKDSFLGS